MSSIENAFKPIEGSRQDTPETKRQVIAHNNVYWCLFPDRRPRDFDPQICEK